MPIEQTLLVGKTATDENKEKMRLIDYESLCKNYKVPATANRYPIESFARREQFLAYDFLFQQCVGLAYAWMEEINAEDMNFSKALACLDGT